MNKSDEIISQTCIDHLLRPEKMINKPDPGIDCFRSLKFPRRGGRLKFGVDDGLGSIKRLEKLINSATIVEGLQYHLGRDKIWVPDRLVKMLSSQRKGMTGGARYLLLPVEIVEDGGKKLLGRIIVFHDRSNFEWQIFWTPGNGELVVRLDKSGLLDQIQDKIRGLITQRLKEDGVKVGLFYHIINYGPDTRSRDFDFWPSWLVFLRTRKSFERELLMNFALIKLVKNDKQYQDFVQSMS